MKTFKSLGSTLDLLSHEFLFALPIALFARRHLDPGPRNPLDNEPLRGSQA